MSDQAQHQAAQAAAQAPDPVPAGYVALPELQVAQGAAQAPRREAVIECRAIRSIQHLRVGDRSGSALVVDSEGCEVYVLVAVEPGAVLMRIFHVSPIDAARLNPLP